jgi:hypothetical protein
VAKVQTDEKLRQQAVQVLTEKLGPVDALRFLASVSREPFNYQRWRKKYFAQYDIEKLLGEVRKHHAQSGS